jgi:hypothetical protein
MTIRGQYFAPGKQHLVYWDTPDVTIGLAVTDQAGLLPPVTHAVPGDAAEGKHQVVVELDGVVVARSLFTVTTVAGD